MSIFYAGTMEDVLEYIQCHDSLLIMFISDNSSKAEKIEDYLSQRGVETITKANRSLLIKHSTAETLPTWLSHLSACDVPSLQFVDKDGTSVGQITDQLPDSASFMRSVVAIIKSYFSSRFTLTVPSENGGRLNEDAQAELNRRRRGIEQANIKKDLEEKAEKYRLEQMLRERAEEEAHKQELEGLVMREREERVRERRKERAEYCGTRKEANHVVRREEDTVTVLFRLPDASVTRVFNRGDQLRNVCTVLKELGYGREAVITLPFPSLHQITYCETRSFGEVVSGSSVVMHVRVPPSALDGLFGRVCGYVRSCAGWIWALPNYLYGVVSGMFNPRVSNDGDIEPKWNGNSTQFY